MTDYFKIYRDYFPADKHIASKKETYTVESVNSDIRHYIARFRRKTKCTSKSAEMGQAIASFSCF
jgi:insertion element IS1 protein InsB